MHDLSLHVFSNVLICITEHGFIKTTDPEKSLYCEKGLRDGRNVETKGRMIDS